MHPAPAGHGVVFRRTDLRGALVPARWDAVVPSQLCTLLAGENGATVSTVEVAEANVASGNFPGIRIVDKAPMVPDYVALITLREEYGLINYLNLFVNQQVRTGRYAELYEKWIGEGEPADLMVPGVYR